jgi:predicted anti-sigma-YlaC factor YlaD
MNTNHFALTLGPCADYEFDLVELHEGSLEAGRAGAVQHHMAHCARCRAYASALGELDAALADALPRPALSPDFDARLRAQIAVLTQAPNRTAALAAAEREHAWLLQNLGRGLSWRTVLNAAALGSVVGGVIVGLDAVAPGLLQAFGLVGPGMSATLTFSIALGAMFAVCGAAFARGSAGGSLLLTD